VREKAIRSELRVKRAPLIHAEIQVPGDKSISHRAVMLASLSNGVCVLQDFAPGEDCQRTVQAMRALGVQIERSEEEPGTLIVHGRYRELTAPKGDIDCGNSGTTMRLLTGLLAGQPFKSRLVGDASLSQRPMGRIITPLTQMGAHITAEGRNGCAPLVIDGGKLHGIAYHLPMASAQVKGTVLLAGLFAAGESSVTEPGQSRDHTERLLQYFLIKLKEEEPRLDEAEPKRIGLLGGQMPESRNFTVPGDISSAAFWLAAAAAQPGARLLVKKIGLNDTRSGILSVLLRMGAHVHEVIEDIEQIEPSGTVEVEGARLHGTVIEGREIPNVIDEIPILAVLGALASGQTIIRDAAELRVKETDRLTALSVNLKAMGAQVQEYSDGLVITGGRPLHGARLPSYGDHRIAMAFAIAGLFAEGETVIEGCECIETSYPDFAETLDTIIAASTSGAVPTPVLSDVRQILPPEGEDVAASRRARAGRDGE
jgi:3-phosphoshikimate 1-carboxyvinyltransferase